MPALLSQRRRLPEWMDQPGLDPALHQGALAGLERINFFSRSLGILWPPIRSRMEQEPGRRWTLCDLACGGGDLPIGLARAAKRAGLHLEVRACDVSPTAIAYAADRAQRAGAEVRLEVRDALKNPSDAECDFIVCSLFLHHLDRDEAIALLATMRERAGTMAVVNDLGRSFSGWLVAWTGTRLLSRSPVVHMDGPRSVAAAWTVDEARALAREAGMDVVALTRHWPWRWRMVWRRP